MKKFFLLVFTSVILLTGCTNFLKSDQLKEKLTAELNYSNAPSFSVSYHLEKNSQGVIIKSVTTAKVGYPFELGLSINDDEWFFNNEWSLKYGEDSYLTEDEYSVTESSANIYVFTILKNISELEIVPVCKMQPVVYCGIPYYGEPDNVIGSVTPFGNTKQILGKSFTVQYNLNSSDYYVREIKVIKDGILLTKAQSEEIIEFGDIEQSTSIYKQTLKLKSYDSNGIVLEPLIVPSINNNYSERAPKILSYKVATTQACKAFYLFKNIDNCAQADKTKKYYLRLVTDKEVTGIKVVERCVKLSGDMLVQDINKNWQEIDENGKLMFNSYDEFIATGYSKDDFIKISEKEPVVSSALDTSSGNYVTIFEFGFDLKVGGIHQWSFIAMNSNGESRETEKAFVYKMENDTKPFWKNNTEFTTFNVTGTMYVDANSVTDYIVYGLDSVNGLDPVSHETTDRIYIKGQSSFNAKSLVTETINEMCNSNVQQAYKTTTAGKECLLKDGNYYKKWKLSNLSRGTAYKLSMCWVNENGYKGDSLIEIVNTQKAMPLDIGLFQEDVSNDGYFEFVTYMTLEEYNEYKKSGGTKLAPFGVVVSASNNHIILINLKEPTQNKKLSISSLESDKESVLWEQATGNNKYSGAELQEKLLQKYSGILTNKYPAFGYAQFYGSKKTTYGFNSKELKWFIPSYLEFFNWVTDSDNMITELNTVLEDLGETMLDSSKKYWTASFKNTGTTQSPAYKVLLPYKLFSTEQTADVTSTEIKTRLFTDAINITTKFFE